MSEPVPTLHMMCGKMAAGKSTLAAQLAEGDKTVLISEDAWLHALFGDVMSSGPDFIHYSAKLRGIMGPHVTRILSAGSSVVLDFQANTVKSRAWMRRIAQNAGAAHQVHVLNPPDALCLARLKARNASKAHEFAPTEAEFHAFAKHFVMPAADEGLNIVMYEDPV